jgi:septum formation protein
MTSETINTLLLASQSASRRRLLDIAQIPYLLYTHAIDERAACSWQLPIDELVISLARHKMGAISYANIAVPENHVLFVLTADTLTQDVHGVIHGKPTSYEEARRMLHVFRNNQARIATGFRIERRIWREGAWNIDKFHEEAVEGTCLFSVPEHSVDEYLNKVPALSCAGGMEIEGYGMQFVKYTTGSYSAIMGLPLFEVRQALFSLGFYNP